MSHASKCPFGGMNYMVSIRPFDMQIVWRRWVQTSTRFLSLKGRISIKLSSSLKVNTLNAINGRWSFTGRMRTAIALLMGLWRIVNHVLMLLLLIGERIMKNGRCSPRILVCNKIGAFLQPRTFVGQVVLRTDLARKLHGFILPFVISGSIFLIRVILIIRLLFRIICFLLILLIFPARFL